jgi:ABC-type uncharacterized transport system permease subunit
MDPLLFTQFVLTGAVRSGTSVLYATLGETVSEKSGVTNLGTEGCMLMGACAGFIVTAQTGSAVLGVLAAGLGGMLLSLIHAFLVVSRGANQLASGLALMFFGLGITSLLGQPYVSVQIEGFNTLTLPGLSAIPFVGAVLFKHDVLTYAAYLLAPLIWAFLYLTRWGLSLRAVGESRAVAFSTGRNANRIQYGAVGFGGLMAGLGGAQLSLAFTHSWVEGMTSGRGFIAVALVIFGMWHPLRAMVGAFLYGGAIAFQLQLQTLGVGVSPYILDMLPYVLTLLVLLAWGRVGRRAMPAELASVFSKSG